MKKILFFTACVFALASCAKESAKEINLYCEHEVLRVYNDPEAEMDTLSYAAGMDIGLVTSLRFADMDLDMEEVIAVVDKELKSADADYDAIQEWNEYANEFNNKLFRPYMMAKQANSRVVTDRPDTLSLPTLYDDTYTKEKMTEYIGVMAANQIRTQRIPANLTWMYKAMRDADNVTSAEEIDANMAITEAEFMNTIRSYSQLDYPTYNLELSEAWLTKVSEKDGINKLGEDKNVYYRINRAGNDAKPMNATDTIGVKYAVYSRTGRVIDSNETYIERLEAQKKFYQNNTMLPDSVRTKYEKQLDEEIAKCDVLEFPFNRFMTANVQEAMKLIGAGGSITIWGDGSALFGYRAMQALPANEAVVVNIELVDVTTVDPLSIQPQVAPTNMQNQTVRPSTVKGAPIKVRPNPAK